MPQYSKPLKLHRGVDNELQFQFLNQQQKPVDITGKVITCRVISADGTKTLLARTLDLTLPLKGIAVLRIASNDMDVLVPQKCFYSLEFSSGTLDYPVYIDQSSSARGDLIVEDSILPSFVPSLVVSIPQSQLFPNNSPETCGPVCSTPITYTSSVITTDGSHCLSIQATYSGFYGNITIQGSTLPDSDWYDLKSTVNLANYSATDGYYVEGIHPYLRVQWTSTGGNVTNVFAR